MKKSYEYLIEALDLLPERTDGEKAKSLKIAANTLSQYKKGERVMDDFACIMVARVLGIDPMRIIAACQEEREKSEERREFWRDFRSTLGTMVAALVLTTLLMMTPTPANAAAAGTANIAYDKCLLCLITDRIKRYLTSLLRSFVQLFCLCHLQHIRNEPNA